MKSISLNNKIDIDLEKLIASRLLIQANSGGGKSYLLRRLLEQSHGKVQQIIIDLEGEFGTLREKYDYILAGKGGDVPADVKSAALLARKLLELNVSAIIDLSEMPQQNRRHFVRLFLDSMIDAPKDLWHPCLVVIDEAHFFVPEKGQSEAASAVIDLATRGRKRGFCAVLATQRLSKLHKDAAAECNNKLVGRTGLDIDMKRAAEELGFTSKEQYHSLRNLEPGEFFAYGPALSREVIKVTVGEVKTTHPEAGTRLKLATVPPTDKMKAVLKKLTDLPAEAQKEAQTIESMTRQILAQNREIAQLKKNPVHDMTVPKRMIDEAVKEALWRRDHDWEVVVKKWEMFVGDVRKMFDKLPPVNPKKIEIKPEMFRSAEFKIKPIDIRPGEIIPMANIEGSYELTGPEQRVLDSIAWMNSIGVDQPERPAVAFLSGYSNTKSTGFTNPCGALRSKSLIEYPNADTISLTSFGRSIANYPEVSPTQEELQRRVLDRLPGPERRMLEILLATYPNEVDSVTLASNCGYSNDKSTGFTNPRGRLRTLGLVEYPRAGFIKARSILFL